MLKAPGGYTTKSQVLQKKESKEIYHYNSLLPLAMRKNLVFWLAPLQNSNICRGHLSVHNE